MPTIAITSHWCRFFQQLQQKCEGTDDVQLQETPDIQDNIVNSFYEARKHFRLLSHRHAACFCIEEGI